MNRQVECLESRVKENNESDTDPLELRLWTNVVMRVPVEAVARLMQKK